MADVSLDVYIQRNKIGTQRNVSLPAQNITKSNVLLKRNGHAAFNSFQPNAKRVFDARAKINPTSFTPVVVVRPNQDARQRLLTKKKLATAVMDARNRIQAKNLPQPPLNVFKNLQLPVQPQPNLDNFNEVQVRQFDNAQKSLVYSNQGQNVMSIGGQLKKTIANEQTTSVNNNNNNNKPILNRFDRSSDNQQEKQVTQINSQSAQQTGKKISTVDTQIAKKSDDKQDSVQNYVSPLQSYRVIVSNLGPNVSYDDVEELFSSCGPLRKIRIGRPGTFEVYYINKESALISVEEYHKRELDDKPMSVSLAFIQGSSDSDHKPLRSKKQMAALRQSIELDQSILSDALFRGSSDSLSHPVDFTVHL